MRSSPAWILYSVLCVAAGIVLVVLSGGRFGFVLIVGGLVMAALRLRQLMR